MSSRFLKQSLFAASVITIGTNLLSRVFGFLREAAVAGYFGTSAGFDTFVLAFTIPELVTFIVFAALPMALIPIIKKVKDDDAYNLSSLFWCGLILFTALFGFFSVLAYMFRDTLLFWLAPKLGGNQLALGKRLAAILAWFVFFRGLEAYFRSWLFAKKHFIVPSLSAILINVVILSSLFLFYGQLGIETLAYGWLAGSMLSFVVNGLFALIVIKPTLHAGGGLVLTGTLLKATFAVALIEAISLIYPVIDRSLAARFLGEGQIAALRYATFLIHIPTGIFVVAYSHASFPWLTDLSASPNGESFGNFYRQSIRLLIFVMGLIAAGVLIFPTDIVRLAFQRGAFDQESLHLTAGPLRYYAAGIVFYSVYMFQMRFYYARKAWLRLGLILAGMLLIKLVCSLGLVDPMELNGLALATAIAWLSGFVVMTWDVGRSTGIPLRDLFSSAILKILLSLLAVIISWIVIARLWPAEASSSFFSQLFRLTVIGTTGTTIYAGLAYRFRLPELQQVIQRIRSRPRSKTGK